MQKQFEKLLPKTLQLCGNFKDFKEILMEQTESHHTVFKMIIEKPETKKIYEHRPEKVGSQGVIQLFPRNISLKIIDQYL